jgi:hypothetical protein
LTAPTAALAAAESETSTTAASIEVIEVIDVINFTIPPESSITRTRKTKNRGSEIVLLALSRVSFCELRALPAIGDDSPFTLRE